MSGGRERMNERWMEGGGEKEFSLNGGFFTLFLMRASQGGKGWKESCDGSWTLVSGPWLLYVSGHQGVRRPALEECGKMLYLLGCIQAEDIIPQNCVPASTEWLEHSNSLKSAQCWASPLQVSIWASQGEE